MSAGVVDLIAKRTRPLHSVLVCEDHATIRECLVRDLAQILPENCEIVSASTGEEAIDRAVDTDLALVDFHLSPGGGLIDGDVLAQRLLAKIPSCIVVGVTANAGEGDQERSLMLSAGCADVWMKPVPLAELQYRLFGSVDLQAHIAPDSGSYDGGHIVVRTVSKAAC